jgi:hypothetical protein
MREAERHRDTERETEREQGRDLPSNRVFMTDGKNRQRRYIPFIKAIDFQRLIVWPMDDGKTAIMRLERWSTSGKGRI